MGDENCKKYWRLWQEGKWAKIIEMGSYSYSRGGRTIFSITVDSNLTPAQKEGADIMAKYVAEADKLKKDHLEAMQKLDEELGGQNAELVRSKSAEAQAQKDSDNAKGEAEPYWAMFKAAHPVEYADITIIYHVKDCILKVAQWMFRANVPTATLKSLVNKLEQHAKLSEGFSVDFALTLAKTIQNLLADTNTSTLAFVTSISERELKRVLRPKTKLSLTAAQMELKQFEDAIEVD